MTIQDKSTSRIVVFDMDETLGYFVEFGVFWESLVAYIKSQTQEGEKPIISQDLFNQVFELYPEFMRPNILSILKYLKHKKETKHCNGIMIYTNNQGPKEWAFYIKEYYEKKINFKLFDQIICAFKVNGKQVEILPGLKKYRQEHNQGSLVFDARIGYEFKEHYRLGFMINNVLNAEYSSRPGDIQPPRTYMIQIQMKF